MTTLDIAAFARFCGPRALASVARITELEAADTLRRWATRAGWPPTQSVAASVLAIALLALGYRIERWALERGRCRVQSADDFAREMWRRFADDRREIEQFATAVGEHHAWCAAQPRTIRRALERAATVRRGRRATHADVGRGTCDEGLGVYGASAVRDCWRILGLEVKA